MVLLGILAFMAVLMLGGFLVDRYDRKRGHKINHSIVGGQEFHSRLRAARQQSRDRTWGRGPIRRLSDRGGSPKSRVRRSQ